MDTCIQLEPHLRLLSLCHLLSPPVANLSNNSAYAPFLPEPSMNLPPEIALVLFQHLNTLEDVANLACASRFFHHVYQQNAHAVYLSVGPRSVECFADAEALLKAQERKDPGPSSLSPSDTVWSRMKRLVGHHRLVLKACKICEGQVMEYLQTMFLPDDPQFCPWGCPSIILDETPRTESFYGFRMYSIYTCLLSHLDACRKPTDRSCLSGGCH